MAFPVDLLDNYSHEDLESSGDDYLSDLRCADPENPEFLSLGNNVKIPICLSTVGFVPIYGGEERHKVLALFAPEDSLAAVALFLADHWWTIDDILRTSAPSREGVLRVKSIGERVVLYVLNRIIYRKQEIEKNEFPFLCHGSHDYAKILWKKGEAIGFYSVKLPGSICSAFLTQSYQLPVLDTMFVRKKHRGKDFGLLMLEDFVDSFTEDALGLRFPLTSFMHSACQKYFERYPGDHDLLWEVEGIGHWHQRTPIASVLQRESSKYKGLEKENHSSQNEDGFLQTPMDHGTTNEQTTEPIETRLSVDAHNNKDGSDVCEGTSEELNAVPLCTRSRSNHLKHPKLGKRMQESDVSEGEDTSTSQASENRPEPVTHVSESSEELLVMDNVGENVAEKEQEVLTENQKQPAQEIPQLCPPCEKQDDKEETDVEPLNGELMEDAIKVSIVTEGQTASEIMDGDSKLQSESSEEATLTLLVPLILDSSVKSTEDSDDNISDKVENDTEATPEEEQQAQQKKRAFVPNADPAVAAEKEEPSNNGLSNSVATETPEDGNSENVSPNTTSSLEEQSEEGGSDFPEAPVVLGQSLVMVELEDISYQQHSEGQKNQMDEQSEESAEPASERAADSSSEEAEIEVPVVDRRTLRRKAKGYKGPPKKKGKLV